MIAMCFKNVNRKINKTDNKSYRVAGYFDAILEGFNNILSIPDLEAYPDKK